jgi:HAD superfamily hydrolase (TIGR01549 family)
MAVRGVIFDLGSTLIHRTGLELEQVKCASLASYAVREWGCRDREALAAHLLELRLAGWRRSEEDHVEVPAAGPLREALAAADLPTDEETLRIAESVFFEPEVARSRLYPGAVEMLQKIAGLGLRNGMISNATSHRLILNITERHGLRAYLDPIVSSAGYGRTKPHPGIFRHVLEVWSVGPEEAVMVGDTLGADILGANTVGMRSILVDIEPNPDNPRFAEAARPSARVTNLAEIPALLRRWNGAG